MKFVVYREISYKKIGIQWHFLRALTQVKKESAYINCTFGKNLS